MLGLALLSLLILIATVAIATILIFADQILGGRLPPSEDQVHKAILEKARLRLFAKGEISLSRHARITHSANEGFLSPEAARQINADAHLKQGWKSVHEDLQDAYKVLGPPPLGVISGSRDGK